MTVIAQTQFTPLPEVLCLVISQINHRGTSRTRGEDARTDSAGFASLEAILRELSHRYHGVQQPSEQLVYQALGSLCSEGNIFHTGTGHSVF